jgi:CAAX protease family protein
MVAVVSEGPQAPSEGRVPWSASMGLLALVIAFAGALMLAVLMAPFFWAFGVEDPEDSSGFAFAATAAQSIAFVAAVIGVTSRTGRPSARKFGFRPFGVGALGWALLALVTYFVLAAIYVELANPPSDELPREFGADESTALAVLTGVLVIGIAPPVEEFFFRGFLYQAFRNRFGVLGAAALSSILWGAIHFKPEFLVPLAMLGVILALLFQKTGSLWPCILVHAVNNAIAFSVTL